jgi:MYXO-CTERM domain-containing protein
VAGDAVQCLPSGALAGNCAALEANIPDAGVLTTGHVTATGCSSSGGPGAAGLLLLAGLAVAFLVRYGTARLNGSSA